MTLGRLKRAASLIDRARKEIDGIPITNATRRSDELLSLNSAIFNFIDAWTPAAGNNSGQQVTWVHPSQLSDAGNPYATKGDPALMEMAKSIIDIGMINPIEADPKGVIITGHMRHRAALLASVQLVPVKIMKGLTMKQRTQRQVAENFTQRKGSSQNVNPMLLVNRMAQDQNGEGK